MPNDFRYTSLIIAVDSSESADRAIGHGLAMASTLGLPIRLVHVVEPLPLSGMDSRKATAAQSFDDAPEDTLGAALLDRHLASIDRPDLDIEPVLLAGDPAEALLRYLEECDRPLLIVGRRGHGRFAELLLGSVSDKLLRHAPCPVTIVA